MDYESLNSITVDASEGGPATIFYKCYVSNKAKILSLTIKDNSWVRITIPKSAKEKYGLQFLQAKAKWILKHLQRPRLNDQVKNDGLLNQVAEPYRKRPDCRIYAEHTSLGYRLGKARTSWTYDETENVLILNLSQTMPCLQEIRALLVSFSRNTLPLHTIDLARGAGIGHKLGRVTIRNQRTRWGSCTSLGTISLNWRLILLPKKLHDAVIQHELAHLLQMNHGPRFKKALAKLDPEYEAHNKSFNKLSPRIISL